MSTKAEQIAKDVAAAVGAGKAVASETVDFNDPNRPKTCLEVDFPILPVNQVAAIEGNAGKPIYQMSKWWARRRSSVFRSMLIAAATKAPDDASKADKVVWDAYYGNHQKKGSFKHLKVADIFMGGGTTIVEGSRLGMQMYGNDLNPVAWFVVKNELAQVDRKAVEALLADVEREVKPQIMPFYACDCPRGHKGTWTHLPTGKVMGADFDPLSLTPEQRKDYSYGRWRTRRGELLPLSFDAERLGPKERNDVYFDAIETIYVFWAKHGPCQVTGCGHRTPVMSAPVVATKTVTVRAWESYVCTKCRGRFDVEETRASIAPGVPQVTGEGEGAWAVLSPTFGVVCPHCNHTERLPALSGKGTNKKVDLWLLVHPSWLAGSPKSSSEGSEFGGTTTDSATATARWNAERFGKLALLEVRGALPSEVTCPSTGTTFSTGVGTVPSKGSFACGKCGTTQQVIKAVHASGKTAPAAAYAIQGYCGSCDAAGEVYGGRFFDLPRKYAAFDRAGAEWESRRVSDLQAYWPVADEVPAGLETSVRTPLYKYNYKRWNEFFNARQLLVNALLLRAVSTAGTVPDEARATVLGGFQQFLRSNNMFCIWNIQRDGLEPFLSKNNLQPPNRVVENGVFHLLGRGNWKSCQDGVIEALAWTLDPWEVLPVERLRAVAPRLAEVAGAGKGLKVRTNDPVVGGNVHLTCGSSTELASVPDGSVDLVITDPPFGDIMQYAELSGLFYSWLRLFAPTRGVFAGRAPPTALEVVENAQRQGKDAKDFYKRLLTACWSEARRILRESGILAFTFHHDKDEPWVAVLESLFEAGFTIEATYPIRADETKGEGSKPGTFGAQKVEFDIIHVCRRRAAAPATVSWARLRRQILQEARRLEELLSHHKKEGLPDADIAVIRRGKALEFFSKHYGQVLVEGDSVMTVKDALAGINQVLDQDAGGLLDPPPSNAAPFTWQFCRMFDQKVSLPRDQVQKYLRGTGYGAEEYVDAGWVEEEDKTFAMTSPLEFARRWVGKWRSGLRGDYEQAMFLIGAAFEGSGINVSDTLSNESFKPHPALAGLLEWFSRRGGDAKIRAAAGRARQLYAQWQQKHSDKDRQLKMFQDEEDAR